MSEPIILLPLSQGKFAIIDFEDFEKVGRVKWSAHRRPGGGFYAKRTVWTGKNQKRFNLHCEIMGAKGIDHINGDGLDCRRENLRLATGQQQQRAFRRKTPGCTSRFRGVSWYKNYSKWVAQIQTNGGKVYLGYFKNEIDAAHAYDKKAKELGFFKEALNF